MSRQHSPTQPQSYTEIGFFAVALTFREYKTLYTTYTGNTTYTRNTTYTGNDTGPEIWPANPLMTMTH